MTPYKCTCGAPSEGKWANIHTVECPINNLESLVHAIAIRHGVVLREPLIRDIVSALREELR